MKKIKALILYAQKDVIRAQRLGDKLSKLGICVERLENILRLGDSFLNQIEEAIVNAKNIVFIISENAVNSEYLAQEILFAYECAKTRDKKIIPIVEWKDYTIQNVKNAQLQSLLNSVQAIYPEDGLHSENDYTFAAGKIYDICICAEKKELLYEKIADLSRIHYVQGISSNLSQLILLLCREIEQERSAPLRRADYKELLRCMERLQGCEELDYTEESCKIAHKRLDAVNNVDELLKHSDFHTTDLFLIAFVLKMVYLIYCIRNDVIDTLSNGDIHGVGKGTFEKYLSTQNFYFKIYNSLIVSENITNENHGRYAEDEIHLILHAKEFAIERGICITRKRSNAEKNEIGDKEKQLYAIADYIRQSNKLFELAGCDSLASDFLNCLKTSYERLRKYSEVIGCQKICAESIERIAEINQQLEQFDETISDNSLAESGLKALLGFRLPGSDDFDVFLSYSNQDADIARSVYHFLKSNLLNPFFDLISLPELSKSEYEDAIMNAMDHSKHFVIILSDLDHMNSGWVQFEMSTFHLEMVEHRKPNANFIFIVTNDVYQKIISTNKKCLPTKYRSYEILRVDDYRKQITNYLR